MEKIKKTKLRWFEYIIRKDNSEVARGIMQMNLEEKIGREDQRRSG